MVLRIFDCDLCTLATFDLLARLHSSIQYVHMGLFTVLYTSNLFPNDRFQFLPISQLIYFTFMSVSSFSWQCALSSLVCNHNVALGTLKILPVIARFDWCLLRGSCLS